MMKQLRALVVLGILIVLHPACGSGGGGGGSGAAGGTGVSFPALPTPLTVPAVGNTGNLAPVVGPWDVTINANGMTDTAVQTALQTALNSSNKIRIHNNGTLRTILLTPLSGATAALVQRSNVVVQSNVVLDGANEITLSGNFATRILELEDKAQLTVQNIKFLNARSPMSGAAIDSLQRIRMITLIHCSFTNCQTSQADPDLGGGALRLWVGQHNQISDCTFTNCAASNGGAVNSLGTQLTIINSTFTNNAAFGTGGGQPSGRGGIGGAVYVDNVSNPDSLAPNLTVTGSVFNANVANDHAGAVFGYTNKAVPSTTTIDRCTFAGNKVVGGNGSAGALYSQDGVLNLQNSTFNANTCPSEGAGIFRPCDTGMNSASNVTSCTFSANSAGGHGGGLWISASAVNLLNLTVAQNVAGDFGGGIFLGGPAVTVNNCVFESNTGTGNPNGGHHTNNSFAGGANLQAPNTAGNPGKTVSTAGTTKVVSTNIGPLQNNMGPTFTRQPLAGSAAIDMAGVAGAPVNDQRGVARTGTAEAGACESTP